MTSVTVNRCRRALRAASALPSSPLHCASQKKAPPHRCPGPLAGRRRRRWRRRPREQRGREGGREGVRSGSLSLSLRDRGCRARRDPPCGLLKADLRAPLMYPSTHPPFAAACLPACRPALFASTNTAAALLPTPPQNTHTRRKHSLCLLAPPPPQINGEQHNTHNTYSLLGAPRGLAARARRALPRRQPQAGGAVWRPQAPAGRGGGGGTLRRAGRFDCGPQRAVPRPDETQDTNNSDSNPSTRR